MKMLMYYQFYVIDARALIHTRGHIHMRVLLSGIIKSLPVFMKYDKKITVIIFLVLFYDKCAFETQVFIESGASSYVDFLRLS